MVMQFFEQMCTELLSFILAGLTLFLLGLFGVFDLYIRLLLHELIRKSLTCLCCNAHSYDTQDQDLLFPRELSKCIISEDKNEPLFAKEITNPQTFDKNNPFMAMRLNIWRLTRLSQIPWVKIDRFFLPLPQLLILWTFWLLKMVCAILSRYEVIIDYDR